MSKAPITLSERATLATLRLGVWSGRTVDQTVTQQVSQTYKAARGAGVYSKQLVAKHYMSSVEGAGRAARATHKLLTLPWADEGERILSNTGYLNYVEQMGRRHQEFDAAVNQFCDGLAEYQREGKIRLGRMFDASDYPSKKDLKDKFSFDVEIQGVPDPNDFRSQLGDDLTKALVKDIEGRTDARLKRAVNDVFQRVYDVTARMAERLKSFNPGDENNTAKNVFRDSLVANIHTQATLLESLNITGDPRIEELKAQLEGDLLKHSPEILRVDPQARKQTATKADEILAKVKSYMS